MSMLDPGLVIVESEVLDLHIKMIRNRIKGYEMMLKTDTPHRLGRMTDHEVHTFVQQDFRMLTYLMIAANYVESCGGKVNVEI